MSTVTMPLEQAISLALLTPMGDPNDADCIWGMPLLIWGSPGIGKSARVGAAAASAGLHMEPVFSAGQHPEDFTGIPVRKGDGGLHRVCALEEVNRLVSRGRGLLFLDEISCAAPTVQAALLKVIMNRYIGDTQLPGGVRIISAANPAEEAAGGWELAPPLANRFIHIEHTAPTAADWGDWLLNGASTATMNYKEGENLVKAGWDSEWSRMRGLLAGFTKRRAELLYVMPREGDPARGRAWPSPRTWEYAGRIGAACGALGIAIDAQLDMIAAAIGEGPAAEFSSWVQDANLPSPESMLTSGWTPDPSRLDRSQAAYTSVAAFVVAQKNEATRKDYATRAWGLFDQACQAGLADVAMPPAQTFVNNGLGLTGGADLARAAKPVMSHLGGKGFTQLANQK